MSTSGKGTRRRDVLRATIRPSLRCHQPTAGTTKLTMGMNSPGGQAVGGIAIYNAMRAMTGEASGISPAGFTVGVDTVSAAVASAGAAIMPRV